jgi:hypothetical protein
MSHSRIRNLKLADILNAANKHYDEGYLRVFFNKMANEQSASSGDTLAKFIVCELRETFNGESSRKPQIATAVRALERAKKDIQNAIVGLNELDPKSKAGMG